MISHFHLVIPINVARHRPSKADETEFQPEPKGFTEAGMPGAFLADWPRGFLVRTAFSSPFEQRVQPVKAVESFRQDLLIT
jgi:hypothetical protein